MVKSPTSIITALINTIIRTFINTMKASFLTISFMGKENMYFPQHLIVRVNSLLEKWMEKGQ